MTKVINGVEYEWANISHVVYDKKTLDLLQTFYKKGVRLIYGAGDFPVSIGYVTETIPKIHPKSFKRLTSISRDLYNHFINLKS